MKGAARDGGGVLLALAFGGAAPLLESWVSAALLAAFALPAAAATFAARMIYKVRDSIERERSELVKLEENRFYFLVEAQSRLLSLKSDGIP
jgi:hypothetical protein